jgi:translation initiation factor IF-3
MNILPLFYLKKLTAVFQVKIVVQFKGRELQHTDIGKELLMKLYKPIETVSTIESSPQMEGRAMAMLIGPKRTG